MDQKILITKIEEYRAHNRRLKEIDEMIVPPFVVKPIACKAKQWNEYITKSDEYQNMVHIKSVEFKNVENKIVKLKSDLIEMLPCSNVWFVTDNEKYAIGHQSSDWHGSFGKLKIRVEPFEIKELPEIHHQITN